MQSPQHHGSPGAYVRIGSADVGLHVFVVVPQWDAVDHHPGHILVGRLQRGGALLSQALQGVPQGPWQHQQRRTGRWMWATVLSVPDETASDSGVVAATWTAAGVAPRLHGRPTWTSRRPHLQCLVAACSLMMHHYLAGSHLGALQDAPLTIVAVHQAAGEQPRMDRAGLGAVHHIILLLRILLQALHKGKPVGLHRVGSHGAA